MDADPGFLPNSMEKKDMAVPQASFFVLWLKGSHEYSASAREFRSAHHATVRT